MTRGKVMKSPQGMFCAKFLNLRCDNKVCIIVWCPSCYRDNYMIFFHANNPVGEAGFDGMKEKYKGKSWSASPGDYLFTPTEYDMCIFLLLMIRRATGNKQDDLSNLHTYSKHLRLMVKRAIYHKWELNSFHEKYAK